MKIICDFYKECKVPVCFHKYEHSGIDINCNLAQKCATTHEYVKCVNISILRKDKLKKINENIL